MSKYLLVDKKRRLKLIEDRMSGKIIQLEMSMGGDIEQLLKDTQNKVCACECLGYHSGNVWYAFSSNQCEGTLMDKDGNFWWPFMYCWENFIQLPYHHYDKKSFIDINKVEELRLKIHAD